MNNNTVVKITYASIWLAFAFTLITDVLCIILVHPTPWYLNVAAGAAMGTVISILNCVRDLRRRYEALLEERRDQIVQLEENNRIVIEERDRSLRVYTNLQRAARDAIDAEAQTGGTEDTLRYVIRNLGETLQAQEYYEQRYRLYSERPTRINGDWTFTGALNVGAIPPQARRETPEPSVDIRHDLEL